MLNIIQTNMRSDLNNNTICTLISVAVKYAVTRTLLSGDEIIISSQLQPLTLNILRTFGFFPLKRLTAKNSKLLISTVYFYFSVSVVNRK